MSNDAKKYQDELQNILKKAQNAMQELKDSVGQEMKAMKNEPQSNLSEKKVFFSFAFFKIDPKWRWMADLAKEESAKEVENVIKKSNVKFRSYSTLGLRDDAEFLFWFASESLEEIQDVVSKIYLTVFGKYIYPTHVYLSNTRPSIYAKESKGHGWLAGEEQRKYVIVYPFIKTREWYLLSVQERQQMMDEHIQVGKKYPQVILNTTYSFGIHDAEFMLAFETDDLHAFQNLIMELRETKVSRYIKVDTPMIVGVKKDIIPLIASLG
ncbi:MAG TPA: chlorite dismutase family protein [Nitrosopumilaceae archaeon]|nr:chlorite dismutase family protein [Nitrosopumilaceae archaeon]